MTWWVWIVLSVIALMGQVDSCPVGERRVLRDGSALEGYPVTVMAPGWYPTGEMVCVVRLEISPGGFIGAAPDELSER